MPGTHSLEPTPSPAVQVTARHNRWVWSGAVAIVGACVVAVVMGVAWGALALAGLMAVCGLARLVIRGPGPAGITIRSRTLDVAMFWSVGAAIAFLALTAPV